MTYLAEPSSRKPKGEPNPMDNTSKPAPLETGDGQQQDDNIDDLGRRQDGSRQDQPGLTKPSKP